MSDAQPPFSPMIQPVAKDAPDRTRADHAQFDPIRSGHAPIEHASAAGLRPTLLGIAVNVVLAMGKAAAGIFGNSYALIADAIESAIDILSSLVVYAGLKVSARPADDDHPHGHGKAEPIAAAVVALFLLAAAVLIAKNSVEKISTVHPMPAAWTLIVLVVVVVVKETLFRHVFAVGNTIGSTAVKGDAWHHRSDALTSVAVFAGISIALIGNHFFPNPRWSSGDDWAALFAAAIILFNGITILRSAVYELTDARPGRWVEEDIRRIAAAVDGVDGLDKCFVRKMGFDYLVELDIRVRGDISVRAGHEIGHAVQDQVRHLAAGGRVTRVRVHVEPTPAG